MSLNSNTCRSCLLYPAIRNDLSGRGWSWNSSLTNREDSLTLNRSWKPLLRFLGRADGPLSSGDQLTSHGHLHLSSFFTPERRPPPPKTPFYSRTTCLISPPGGGADSFFPFFPFHFHFCNFTSITTVVLFLLLFFIIYQFLLLFLRLPPFLRFLFCPSCTTRTLLLLSLFTSV